MSKLVIFSLIALTSAAILCCSGPIVCDHSHDPSDLYISVPPPLADSTITASGACSIPTCVALTEAGCPRWHATMAVPVNGDASTPPVCTVTLSAADGGVSTMAIAVSGLCYAAAPPREIDF
jgi:hypothetical protein